MKTRLIDDDNRKQERVIFDRTLGIIFNGEDNLKPIRVGNLIDNSVTASQCAWIYETFLNGGGFQQDLSQINLSSNFWEQKTANDFLSDIAYSLSRYQGAFIHVRYNANYEKHSFKVIPYPLCRLGRRDSKDFSGKIVVAKKGWNLYANRENLLKYDVYNPNPIIIKEQVRSAGGWNKYKGQVYYFRLADEYIYPRSLIETAYLHANAEEKLAIFYNSIIKRGFNNITIIRHKKFESEEKQREFDENARQFNRVENTGRLLAFEDDFDDDRKREGNFRFETMANDTKADKYALIERSCANYIRKAFKNIPPQLVDYVQGKLGSTSGEDLKKAQAVYNTSTAKDRKKIERLFTELFNNFRGVSYEFNIKQYSLLDDGTIL